jgi:hypothetical protein
LSQREGFAVVVEAQSPDVHDGFLLYVPTEMKMHYVYAVRNCDAATVGAAPQGNTMT